MSLAQPKVAIDVPARGRRRPLDSLEAEMARHLHMFQPDEAGLLKVLKLARKEIPGLASSEDALRIFRHNPEYVLALSHKTPLRGSSPEAEGFIAFLPLNMLGLQNLALGTFNGASPDVRLLARAGERPAGIYLWGLYAPGPLALGMALFADRMSQGLYAGIDIYSRPVTDAGLRFHEGLGFVEGCTVGDIEAPNVWKFRREPERPLYDSYVPKSGNKKNIGITVAHSFEDLMRVVAIRNAVYIGEQECPYEEEYDGNDLAATHLLAYMGDEPIGCMRMRFFAGFVKFERMAIRKEFRKSRAASLLLQGAMKLAQKKGYRRILGHSQARLVNFWARFGFRPLEGAKPFVFSDYDYIEIVADMEPDPDPIVLGADPYVLIRPEGRWHVPGILESSASRQATNPSVARKSAATEAQKPEVA
jgi:predicted GNAT family N-acyltransferase